MRRLWRRVGFGGRGRRKLLFEEDGFGRVCVGVVMVW